MMHEILIISGKGGTGKTSLTAAFAHLAENHVICDLDVDAPDLHLLLKPDSFEINDFVSGHEARIVEEKCENCGQCVEVCRFGAVIASDPYPVIDGLRCEGCKVCVALCPADAIAFPEKHCGRWYVSNTRFGPMVHAQLFPGEENSGRLVALLKKRAKELAKAMDLRLLLADGPPGIGCPVISSLSGADLAVVVTEPTLSGHHDLRRVIELCDHFRIPAGVIVNKFDLNPDQTSRIARFCDDKGIRLLSKLPHDDAVTEAMVRGQAITEFQNNGLSEQIRETWTEIKAMVDEKKDS